MSKQNGYSTLGKVEVFATLALTLSVLVISPAVFNVTFVDSNWWLLGLGSAGVLLGGLRYFASAVKELRSRRPGQYVLGSLALLLLSGYSVWQSLFDWQHDAWYQAVSVASLLAIGDWFFHGLISRIQGAVPDFQSLVPEFADLIDGKEISRIRASELEIGAIVLVRPGATVPADGVVVQGQSDVDESAITGESIPVHKSEGMPIYAGTFNASAKKSNKALTIRITAVGGDLLVESAQRAVSGLVSERAAVDELSKKLTFGLFILTIAVALIGSGLWLALAPTELGNAVFCASAVLLAANLSIVGNVSSLVNTLMAAVAGSGGILVRTRTALYRLRKSHIVVLNLVGTLTAGDPKLVEIHLAKGTSLGSANEVLAIAAAADANSDHLLARLISATAKERNLAEPALYEIEKISTGVSARMDGSSVLVGSAATLTQNNVPIDVQDLVKVADANSKGNSVVYVVIDYLLVGYLEFKDEVRETAREAVTRLRLQRKRVIAISGEAEGVVAGVCASLGIVEYFAEVLHERKLDIIDRLRQDGSIITVVGDAFADAQTLAASDVAVALGVGGELGTQSADVLVISDEPRAVSRIMQLAGRSNRTVNSLLIFVTILNVLGVSAAGFYPVPLATAGLVLVSTLIAGNSIWRLGK
jgi:Cu2+-exporting ATPase